MSINNREILIGINPQEAYSQAIVEGMINPGVITPRSFLRRTVQKGGRLRVPKSYFQERKWSKWQVAQLFDDPLDRAIVTEEWFGHTVELPMVPRTFWEQWDIVPKNQEERDRIAKELERGVLESLVDRRVRVHHASSRAKTALSTNRKRGLMSERRKELPVVDIYGVRVVVDEYSVIRAANAIRSRYYCPSWFPWGIKGDINYQIKDENNPGRILYQARHLRVLFGGRGVRQIAEIQIMTPAEFEIAKASRAQYEEKNMKPPSPSEY